MREVRVGLAPDASRAKLIADGVAEQRIYVEAKDGSLSGFPSLEKSIRGLREGDVLVVPETIQLAPNARKFEATLNRIGAKGAAVRFLDVGKDGETMEDPGQHARVMEQYRKRSASQRRAMTSGEARAMAKRRKRKPKPDKKSPQFLADLAIWRNRDLDTIPAAKAIGKSRATCYEHFGKRGVLKEKK